MPLSPNKNESQSAFLDRCLNDKSMKSDYATKSQRESACKRIWDKQRKNMRVIDLRENKTAPDMEKIRAVAMNPDLSANEVFDFGTFVICKSGVNRNHCDITPEGQQSAKSQWVGKAILYKDHESTTENQIGRIYDAWTIDDGNSTLTMGKGFGVITDDHKDIFARIENGIHREMSCAYEPVTTLCSTCNAELTGNRYNACPNDCKDFHARDVAFIPDHVSFVGRPAVEGAGLIAADTKKWVRVFGVETPEEAEKSIRELRRDAEDGKEYRRFVAAEFIKWYGLTNSDATDNEITLLAEKLTAKEMARLARIEKDRYHEVLPKGGKQLSIAAPESDIKTYQEPMSLRDLRSAMKETI